MRILFPGIVRVFARLWGRGGLIIGRATVAFEGTVALLNVGVIVGFLLMRGVSGRSVSFVEAGEDASW